MRQGIPFVNIILEFSLLLESADIPKEWMVARVKLYLKQGKPPLEIASCRPTPSCSRIDKLIEKK